MIVRSPVAHKPDETLYPALNLWCLGGEFTKVFGLNDKYKALSFFYEYWKLLLFGPLRAWLECGVGLEPHMQNTIVVVKRDRPVRMVFRDVDSSILSRSKIEGLWPCEARDLRPETWAAMPCIEVGERRLLHALHLGHIWAVASALIQTFEVDPNHLQDAIDSTYRAFVSRYGFAHEVAAMQQSIGVSKRAR
jgi:hypothetical protein